MLEKADGVGLRVKGVMGALWYFRNMGVLPAC